MLVNIADTVNPSACHDLDLDTWLETLRGMLKVAMEKNCDMGKLERLIEQQLKELGRPILAEAAQQLADQQALVCPRCEQPLQVERHQQPREVSSVFGKLPLLRSYGFCPRCREYFHPADDVLGLQDRAPASPRVQEICALTVLESPVGQAHEHLRRLTGLDLGESTMHREARRQGERALGLREADVALSETWEGVSELTQRSSPPPAPFTLILEIDAWHIRERDYWGKTRIMRKNGEEFSRWHWVYAATIFRLDQRGRTHSGRPLITERGYVATRQGLEAFEKQLYVEALQRGLSQAESVLVVADGAIWIWNLAQNRFKDATQRVDFYHVSEHLWTVANDLYGQGTPEAREWVERLLGWLKRRKNGAVDVIEALQQIRENLDGLTAKQQKTLDQNLGYFQTHQDRMDYKTAKALDQPIGSGAMESTCAQYQCRFKRTGQFWSLEGDEAFLALATLHRNGRWWKLFPHDRQDE